MNILGPVTIGAQEWLKASAEPILQEEEGWKGGKEGK